MRKTLVAIMTAALLVSCGQKEAATPDAAAAAAPAQGTRAQAGVVTQTTPAQSAAAAPAPASAAAPDGAMASAKLAGTVAETMNSGGYTYIRLASAQGDVWIATPQAEVKKGQQLTINAQMTAEKFESSTLKRTFDKIVFGTIDAGPQPRVATAPAMPGMPPGHPSMPGAAMNAMGTPADHMKASAKIGDVNVPKAEGANAKTVAEAWSGRAALAGKEVVVRGKVVKFLGGIMGTNFLHVRDGSGSADKGDHDLTVTTNDVAAVGDVVTVSGTLLVDKDFGAGYRYPVIVENARIRK